MECEISFNKGSKMHTKWSLEFHTKYYIAISVCFCQNPKDAKYDNVILSISNIYKVIYQTGNQILKYENVTIF
jgi:hypothetical protein